MRFSGHGTVLGRRVESDQRVALKIARGLQGLHLVLQGRQPFLARLFFGRAIHARRGGLPKSYEELIARQVQAIRLPGKLGRHRKVVCRVDGRVPLLAESERVQLRTP